MFKKAFVCLVIVLLFTAVTLAGSNPEIQKGNWEITVEFEMPGMPMKMPPNTYTQCIDQDNPIPKDEKPNQTCEMKDMKRSGNTVTWTMVCTNPGGKMTGKGEITYMKDKMKGAMTMEGQGFKMVSTYKGHRIGSCP